jgi:DNA repair protein RecO (recombination protein O)
MEWTANALIIGTRAHGESSAIIDVFCREHGHCTGLVRGGNARRLRPVLQIGNMAQVTWRARLSEHLGTFSVDAGRAFGAEALTDRLLLAGVSSMCALLQITPERQAYPRLYDTVMVLLEELGEADIWLPLLVRFEVALLEEVGFGLDLSTCAATGVSENLTHVSPRSGRAVSHDAAQPYLEQLFALPTFLRDPQATASMAEVLEGLTLTGHFLERRVYAPHQMSLPPARARLIENIARVVKNALDES